MPNPDSAFVGGSQCALVISMPAGVDCEAVSVDQALSNARCTTLSKSPRSASP
jgi:hypothetical protein